MYLKDLSNLLATTTTSTLKPPAAIKISSAQILRLNPASNINSVGQATSAGSSCLATNSILNNSPSSTIVKLTPPTQININSFNKNQFQNNSTNNIGVLSSSNNSSMTTSVNSIIPNNAGVHLNSGAPFLLNAPYLNNTQQLKHFVHLPKSTQKLIILPTSASSPNTNIKQNILINSK